MTPREAFDALLAALPEAVAGDAAGTAVLPAVFVGAPSIRWEGFCAEATEAEFPVQLVVRLENGCIGELLDRVDAVQAALEAIGAATTGEATPFSYDRGGGVTAAGLEFTVTMSL